MRFWDSDRLDEKALREAGHALYALNLLDPSDSNDHARVAISVYLAAAGIGGPDGVPPEWKDPSKTLDEKRYR